LASGGEFLFQAKDDEEVNQWVRGIQDVSQAEGAGSSASRAQTLPASSQRELEPKKRSFFTLKKK